MRGEHPGYSTATVSLLAVVCLLSPLTLHTTLQYYSN
jgi:hypothetical protein